jgi:hypothetical protein
MPSHIPVLSDHAYQSTTFETIDPITKEVQTQLHVGTWNLQDICRSKATQGAYSNNPWDVDEDRPSFEARKRKQIEKIEAKIKNGDDIVFLQEIDFLLVAANKLLKNEFIVMLKRNGYELVLSHRPVEHGFSQQPMAMIYNTNKLQLKSVQGVFPAPPNVGGVRKYRGYETSFTLKNAPFTPVVATNLHLLYGHNYKSEIEEYQKKQERAGVLSIMGGDTNNVQNENLSTALGNWNVPTNISRDPKTGQLTTCHDDPKKQKAYDRFFGVPSAGCYLRSQPSIRTEHVFIKNSEAKFRPIEDNNKYRPVSISRVGERWRRGKEIIFELEQEYFKTKDKKQHDKLLEEMGQVIHWKKLDVTTCFSNPSIQEAYLEVSKIKRNIKQDYAPYIEPLKRQSLSGRFHLFQAASNQSRLQGDALKSEILDTLYEKINTCSSLGDLQQKIATIKKSPDYKILATGQGLFTVLLLGLMKTSSIVAFEKFCAEKEKELSSKGFSKSH